MIMKSFFKDKKPVKFSKRTTQRSINIKANLIDFFSAFHNSVSFLSQAGNGHRVDVHSGAHWDQLHGFKRPDPRNRVPVCCQSCERAWSQPTESYQQSCAHARYGEMFNSERNKSVSVSTIRPHKHTFMLPDCGNECSATCERPHVRRNGSLVKSGFSTTTCRITGIQVYLFTNLYYIGRENHHVDRKKKCV